MSYIVILKQFKNIKSSWFNVPNFIGSKDYIWTMETAVMLRILQSWKRFFMKKILKMYICSDFSFEANV